MRLDFKIAYRGTLTAEMGPNDLECIVDSIGDYVTPVVLCIEPESDTEREYILFDGTFDATTFRTTKIGNRYGPGSAQGSNITHGVGSQIWGIVAAEHFTTIHDELDSPDHGNVQGVADHDHTQYMRATAVEAFTSPVGGVTPIAGGDLSTQDYVTIAMAGAVSIGQMWLWAGAAGSPPNGWLLCNGQAVSRGTYSALFSIIGTTFGAGNGTSTFNLPDMRGRFPLGANGNAVGATGGSILHSHSQPTHTHTTEVHSHSSASHSHDIGLTDADSGHQHTQGDTGSVAAHTHTGPSHTHSGTSLAFGTSSTANITTVLPYPGSAGLYSADTLTHDHSEGSPGTHRHEVFESYAGSHTHDIYSRAPVANASQHTHPGAALGGTTGAAGTGSTGSGGGHSHTNPSTDTSATHTHDVGDTDGTVVTTQDSQGDLAAAGGDTTGTATPAYAALHYVIRAA